MNFSRAYQQFDSIGQFPNSLGSVRGTLLLYKLGDKVFAISRQANGTFRAFGRETLIAALALLNSVAGFLQLAPNTTVGDLNYLATDAECVTAGFAVMTDVDATNFPASTEYIEGSPILQDTLFLKLLARERIAVKALAENGITVNYPDVLNQ